MGHIKKAIELAKTGVKKAINVILATFDLRDVFVFTGIVLMAAGLWQIYPPASLIASGALLFWVGIRRAN